MKETLSLFAFFDLYALMSPSSAWISPPATPLLPYSFDFGHASNFFINIVKLRDCTIGFSSVSSGQHQCSATISLEFFHETYEVTKFVLLYKSKSSFFFSGRSTDLNNFWSSLKLWIMLWFQISRNLYFNFRIIHWSVMYSYVKFRINPSFFMSYML